MIDIMAKATNSQIFIHNNQENYDIIYKTNKSHGLEQTHIMFDGIDRFDLLMEQENFGEFGELIEK